MFASATDARSSDTEGTQGFIVIDDVKMLPDITASRSTGPAVISRYATCSC